MGTKNTDQWGSKIETNLEFRKTSALENGQSIEGTVIALRPSTKFPGNTDLVMKGTDGKTFNLSPSGNLKYAIRDGLIKLNHTYKFQREGTTKIKGMSSGVFGIYPAKVQPANNSDDSI